MRCAASGELQTPKALPLTALGVLPVGKLKIGKIPIDRSRGNCYTYNARYVYIVIKQKV